MLARRARIHDRIDDSTMTPTDSAIDWNHLDDGSIQLRSDPFPFLVARNMLREDARAALAAGFPAYAEAGFFPHQTRDCGASVNALVDDLTSKRFSDLIGAQLGIGSLGDYPTLVTLCRSLNRRHGTIHTDSKAKIATALVYLSPDWPDISEGCLRFLTSIDDIDALAAPEIRPLYGTLAAFKRCENSFHGHLPHEGVRPVIQVAWLTSEAEKLRKTRRGGVTRWVKSLLGSLDKRFGAGRGRNASHQD